MSPVTATSSGPAFLSRFPRSLSQLHLKKKSTDRSSVTGQTGIEDNQMTSDGNNINTIKIGSTQYQGPLMASPTNSSSNSSNSIHNSNKKFNASSANCNINSQNGGAVVTVNDIPPPLPQRNISRKSLSSISPSTDDHLHDISKKHVQISDLDSSLKVEQSNHSKKKSKGKHKTSSNPEASCLQFIQMESNNLNLNFPPPLPPRQSQLVSGNQIIMNQSCTDSPDIEHQDINRPLPNSINTILNFPLISTTQSVMDNFNIDDQAIRSSIVSITHNVKICT